MARGEPAKRGERGPSLAIGASFLTLALGALVLVLFATREEAPPPPLPPAPMALLPFVGADTALGPLGTRACRASDTAAIDHDLEARGYVAAAGWRVETGALVDFDLDVAELEDACGVVAVFSPSSGLRDVSTAGATPGVFSCSATISTVAACGSTHAHVAASGSVHVRTFLMPGVTPGDVERSGLPVEVALAHVEAEALLAPSGWTASDEVVVVPSGVAATTGSVLVTPPAAPRSGCVGWVLVSDTMSSSAPATWSATGGAARDLSTDSGNMRTTLGGASCTDTSGARLDTSFALSPWGRVANRPVFFRAYTPAPLSPGAPPAARIRGAFALHAVDVSALHLPASTPCTPAP